MTGFPCPRCGAPTRVIETRHVDGGLRRRRCCAAYACSHKITTAELAVGQRWIDGNRTRGPVVAIRYRDLQTIAKLVNDVIQTCPEAEQETPVAPGANDAGH